MEENFYDNDPVHRMESEAER
jgi:hypothetical protein